MKRKYYLHITVLAIFVCCLFSCLEEDFFTQTQLQGLNDFSLEEAKTYFRERAENQLSRSNGSD